MTDAALAAKTIETSLRMYPDHDVRVGMRSGTMDAAHLCDAIAKEILGSGRKSRQRLAFALVATRCGDAIHEMRDLVTVS